MNPSFRHFTATRILSVTSPSLTQPKNGVQGVTGSSNYTENLTEISTALGKQIAMKHFLMTFLILLLADEQKRPLCKRIKKSYSPKKMHVVNVLGAMFSYTVKDGWSPDLK